MEPHHRSRSVWPCIYQVAKSFSFLTGTKQLEPGHSNYLLIMYIYKCVIQVITILKISGGNRTRSVNKTLNVNTLWTFKKFLCTDSNCYVPLRKGKDQ